MAVLIVLLVSWVVFRALGAFGVATFSSWHDSARFAVAAMFLFTGIAHFTKTKYEMARMVPNLFPHPMLMVYVAGVCELLGAVGVILSRTRVTASVALIVMLVCLFPANVKAAREGLTVAGKPATKLWLRLPMQILFIGLVWWSGLRR
jgi:uncharacterized membrane protein